jgi:hypothetical protein
VIILALVVFAVTAWFLGLRPGGIAGGVSFAILIAAQVVPGTALVVYGLHILWIAGMVWLGPKLSRMRRPAPKAGLGAEVGRWWRRGRAIWKSRG